jgi:hypothetical protein
MASASACSLRSALFSADSGYELMGVDSTFGDSVRTG